MIEFPDRFVFALDNVWAEHWEKDYGSKIKLWRQALGALPVEVAGRIAHGNAERLYQLSDELAISICSNNCLLSGFSITSCAMIRPVADQTW